MPYPEVDWTLEQLDSVVEDTVAPVRRVDRDEPLLYDGDGDVPDMTGSIRNREEKLKKANYVAASRTTGGRDPIGVDGDDVIQPIVEVRIEGLHVSKFGHVDPEGVDGAPFEEFVDDVKQALRATQLSPSVDGRAANFVRLYLENERSDSSLWEDFYRERFDVRFVAQEDPA